MPSDLTAEQIGELEYIERLLREMEDRPRLGRPKKLHVEIGMTVRDCVCDEKGGLFNTGDADLAVVLCKLYNHAPALIAAAKRDQTRSNAYADLPGVGRVSHADAHDMAIRFIRRHFDGDRCEKMPLASIPADPSRDHDIRLLAYIEQQAEVEARTTSAEQRAVAAEGRVKELAQALGSMLYICGQRLMVANPRNDTHGHKYAEQVIAEGKAVIARTALAQPPEELYRTELENDELNRQQANRQIQEENP